MKGFTVKMALVDAIPVIFYCLSTLKIAQLFSSALFLTGAILCSLGGLMKVLWKLCLGLNKGDIKLLNKLFLPLMVSGFLIIVASLILNFKRINFAAVLAAVFSMPSVVFFAAGFGLMLYMCILAKKFRRNNADDNWKAQFVNAAAQICFFIGLLFA